MYHNYMYAVMQVVLSTVHVVLYKVCLTLTSYYTLIIIATMYHSCVNDLLLQS